ncbi:MAG: bifunctional aspartate kinase/homoserine dehydrogenase I, partial [Spirochaetales bacterium]|nr:bifunctional aspartate kinase/homoserine dehydrogenase I [Spirochaetales bacterium]
MGKAFSVFKFDRELYSSKEGLDKIIRCIKVFKNNKLVIIASQNYDLENSLEELIQLAVSREELLWSRVEKLKSEQLSLIAELIPSERRQPIETEIRHSFQNIEEVLKSVWLVGECSDLTKDYVSGLGNIWITQMLSERLKSDGLSTGSINSKEIIDVEYEDSGVAVILDSSKKKLQTILENESGVDVFVATGGMGKSSKGRSVSLGRHGMEVTASVYANLLFADELVFWSDSDGVKSADPDKVPAAVTIPRLSYAEATELAYFGAKILHPAAFTYAIHKKIPIRIRNIENPEFDGTIISDSNGEDDGNIIKGFSIVDNISLLNIEGSGMVGVPGISSRL